jgi:hypothetical protein
MILASYEDYLFPVSHSPAFRIPDLNTASAICIYLHAAQHRVAQSYGSLGRGTGNVLYRSIRALMTRGIIDAILHDTSAHQSKET